MVWRRVIKVRFIKEEGEDILLNFLAFNFDIQEEINQPARGKLEIFNPSSSLSKNFFKEKTRVQIMAGYESLGEGLIFEGEILSINAYRESADTKYVLMLLSHSLLSEKPIDVSLSGANTKSIIQILNRNREYSIEVDRLPQKTYPSFNRFLTPLNLLRELAGDSGSLIYFQNGGRITFREPSHDDFISSFHIDSLALQTPLTRSIENEEETLSFSTLLNPNYSLLSSYLLSTPHFKGEVYPLSLQRKGSNYTGDFKCSFVTKLKGEREKNRELGYVGKMQGDF